MFIIYHVWWVDVVHIPIYMHSHVNLFTPAFISAFPHLSDTGTFILCLQYCLLVPLSVCLFLCQTIRSVAIPLVSMPYVFIHPFTSISIHLSILFGTCGRIYLLIHWNFHVFPSTCWSIHLLVHLCSHVLLVCLFVTCFMYSIDVRALRWISSRVVLYLSLVYPTEVTDSRIHHPFTHTSMHLPNHLCSLSPYISMNVCTLICVKIYTCTIYEYSTYFDWCLCSLVYLFIWAYFLQDEQTVRIQEKCGIHHVSRSIKLNI